MHKIKVNSNWGMEIDFSHEKYIEFWVDNFNGIIQSKADVKVLFLCEPVEIVNLTSLAIQNQAHFDYIFTHNQDVLDNCDNAVMFEFGGCWVRDYHFPKKEFSVSTIVGFKKMAQGHVLRHDLWRKQTDIKIPKKFYMSSRGPQGLPSVEDNPRLGDDKSVLFDSMFHIVIENCARKNWFTEKIIDPFQTKSLPIYWGCPNIGDWFNTDGMIIVNSVDEMIQVCNELTPDVYESKLSAIEENFEISKGFCNLSDRAADKLKELLG